MKRRMRQRSQPILETMQTVLFIEDLSSIEHYLVKGKKPERVLRKINLQMQRAESWGVYGRSCFEIKLLLEIMANITPYHDGRCVLVERGMMRHKRVILDHVFYIGTSTMLYENMNVLEYLMFATARRKKVKPVYRQEQIFELLLELGLGYLSLAPVERLTAAERAVIILLVAASSDSVMIVFNFPEYSFEGVLAGAIQKIASLIRAKNRTLILGARDCCLIEKACSHTAYVADGAIIYQGTVEELRLQHDKILLTIEDKDVPLMLDKLASLLPRHQLVVKDGSLLIIAGDEGAGDDDPLELYQKIVAAGFAPQQIHVNPKTVPNAYEEIARRHDLQK